MKKPVKLLYLTYQENILRSGILYTQVIRMLECMRENAPKAEITLLSFLSPQLMWRERKGLSTLRARLTESNIGLITLPMLIPSFWRWFPQLLIPLWIIPVTLVGLYIGATTIHARGYCAGFIGCIAAKLVRCGIIFDPRGPFPDEMVMNQTWSRDGATYRVWKKIETWLIRKSDAVIGVTPEFRDEYRQRVARHSYFVPNRADTRRFTAAVESYRSTDQFVKRLNTCTLLFIGEMHAVWNDPELVIHHYKALNNLNLQAKLRLITRASSDSIQPILLTNGVDLGSVEHLSGNPEDMPYLMQGSSLGLIFRAVDVHSSWPVKIAEYLSAGIPIVVDKSMRGLPVDIITRYKLGFVADTENLQTYQIAADIMENWAHWSQRCIDYARRRLDIASTSRQYLRIYRQTLTG